MVVGEQFWAGAGRPRLPDRRVGVAPDYISSTRRLSSSLGTRRVSALPTRHDDSMFRRSCQSNDSRAMSALRVQSTQPRKWPRRQKMASAIKPWTRATAKSAWSSCSQFPNHPTKPATCLPSTVLYARRAWKMARNTTLSPMSGATRGKPVPSSSTASPFTLPST